MRRVIRQGRRVRVVGAEELERRRERRDTEPVPADVNRSAAVDLWNDNDIDERDEGEDADRDIDEGELEDDELDLQARRHAAGFAGMPTNARTVVRWGDTAVLTFKPPGQSATQSNQLLQVRFPRPMICSVRLVGELFPLTGSGPLAALQVTTLELIVGVGSAKSQIRKSWLNQPNPLQPLDVTLPDIPIETLLATVSAVATADGKDLVVRYTLAVSPTVLT